MTAVRVSFVAATVLLVVGLMAVLLTRSAAPATSPTAPSFSDVPVSATDAPLVSSPGEVLDALVPSEATDVAREAAATTATATFDIGLGVDDLRERLEEILLASDWSLTQRDTVGDLTRIVYAGPDGNVLTATLVAAGDITEVALVLVRT